jgi:hypothetical protein
MFSYRLSTQAFAAAELARWALKPIAAARYQPKPPRLICFFGRTEGGRQASYQLTIHRNGKKAHIDGPDISAARGAYRYRWQLGHQNLSRSCPGGQLSRPGLVSRVVTCPSRSSFRVQQPVPKLHQGNKAINRPNRPRSIDAPQEQRFRHINSPRPPPPTASGYSGRRLGTRRVGLECRWLGVVFD